MIMCVMGRFTGLARGIGMICKKEGFFSSSCKSKKQSADCGCSQVFVSFGGLLLYIEGPYAKLNPLRIDYVYLLMKR
jgi:RNA polymerase Rpb8